MSTETQRRSTSGTAFTLPTGPERQGLQGIVDGYRDKAAAPIALFPAAVGEDGAAGGARVGNRAARRAATQRQRANARVLRGTGRRAEGEAGMATAEYAIATLAAVGFAALLVAVLSSGEVRGLLMSLITSALNFG